MVHYDKALYMCLTVDQSWKKQNKNFAFSWKLLSPYLVLSNIVARHFWTPICSVAFTSCQCRKIKVTGQGQRLKKHFFLKVILLQSPHLPLWQVALKHVMYGELHPRSRSLGQDHKSNFVIFLRNVGTLWRDASEHTLYSDLYQRSRLKVINAALPSFLRNF